MALKSTKKRTAFDRFASAIATEALFDVSNEKIEAALQKVQALAEKCTTDEEIAAIDLQLTAETEKFNSHLEEFDLLAQQYRAGTLEKDELGARVKPVLAELKDSSKILNLDQLDESEDDAITEEELTSLRAYLLAAKEVLSRRRLQLSGNLDDGETTAMRDDMMDEPPEDEVSTESAVLSKYRVPKKVLYPAFEHFENVVDKSVQAELRAKLKDADDIFASAKEAESNPKQAIPLYKKAMAAYMTVADAYDGAERGISIKKAVLGAVGGAAISAATLATISGIKNRGNIKADVKDSKTAAKEVKADKIAGGKNKAVTTAVTAGQRAGVIGGSAAKNSNPMNTYGTSTKARLGAGGTIAGGAAVGAGAITGAQLAKAAATAKYIAKKIAACKEALNRLGVATESLDAAAMKASGGMVAMEKTTSSYGIPSNLSPLARKIYQKALEEVEEAIDADDGVDDSEELVDEIVDPEVQKLAMSDDTDTDDVDPEEIEEAIESFLSSL